MKSEQDKGIQSLKDAVFTVLEGFTLPHDVRKILEGAYYKVEPVQEPVGYEYGNSYWDAANPRITDDVKRFGSPRYAAPVAAPVQDDYKVWYEEAMVASNEAGFVGVGAAETIRELDRMLCDMLTTPPAQQAVPEGWKLVPIKPTMQMIDALADTDPEHESVWDAVLAATPEKGEPK